MRHCNLRTPHRMTNSIPRSMCYWSIASHTRMLLMSRGSSCLWCCRIGRCPECRWRRNSSHRRCSCSLRRCLGSWGSCSRIHTSLKYSSDWIHIASHWYSSHMYRSCKCSCLMDNHYHSSTAINLHSQIHSKNSYRLLKYNYLKDINNLQYSFTNYRIPQCNFHKSRKYC